MDEGVAESDRVHGAEDDRVRAYSKGESRNDRHRKGRARSSAGVHTEDLDRDRAT